MVLSNAVRNKQEPVPQYTRMKPASHTGGVATLVAEEARKGTLIRVAPVVCLTRGGSVTKPVESVLLVKHVEGGDEMLPQGECQNVGKGTPHDATLRLLMRYHREPMRIAPLISASCIVLGTHKHTVPKNRHKGEVRSVALMKCEEITKLLVFVKVCVSTRFKVDNEEIESSTWVESLEAAEKVMNTMRSTEKFFAEMDAIEAATKWTA